MAADNAAISGARSPRYQVLLVGLLSLNFGIVFFDRNALGFLMPFIQPELELSNTQVGLLSSALALTWSIAAFAVGGLSDALGKRKVLLVASTVVFSLCSFLSGFAASFMMLLFARMLMGIAEGGVMPISHAIIAQEVAPERRGLAQGVAQNFGSSLLGSFAAPVLLAAFATYFGWRNALLIAGVPGLISALLIWILIKEPAMPSRAASGEAGERMNIATALKQRNILICALMSVLLVSYLVICWAFMPLFLTQMKGITPVDMGWLMGTLGISGMIGSFAISGLSDVIGRRPVMVAMPFISLVLPLGALYLDGPFWSLVIIFIFGSAISGAFPLFMATVPSESVDPRHAATVLGLCMGSGEILGGVLAPSLAGVAADASDLSAPLWIMAGLALISGFVAMGVRETAPSRRRAAA